MLFADVRSTGMIYGALPGEIFLNDRNREIAQAMAAALFGEKPEPMNPHCPLCGGSTFRFLSHARIRCMLCSNEGTLETRSGETRLHIRKSDHDLFLTREDALAHRAWLLSMKTRFKEQKEDLKAITSAYRQDGVFLTPGERD